MKYLRAFLTAMSTYSIIPMPKMKWEEDNMKYAIMFLPFVGVIIAALSAGWYLLCQKLELSGFLFAGGMTAIPVIVTGGIHVDGFMDTVDALSSHAEKEKKIEILKDPHSGAFSIIYVVIYFLLQFVMYNEIALKANPGEIITILFIFPLSRAASSLMAVILPKAKKEGMLNSYTDTVSKSTISLTMGIVIYAMLSCVFVFSPVTALIMLILGLITTILYARSAKKSFGGVSGDTAGFYLQVMEGVLLFSLLAGVIWERFI